MHSIKSGILLTVSLGFLTYASVTAWATPNGATGATPIAAQAPQQRPAPQPMPNEMQPKPGQEPPSNTQASSSTFTGTVVKDGENFLLKDSSGAMYKLDDSSRASTFEGKTVKVTGKLDTDAKLIHVESIEAVSA